MADAASVLIDGPWEHRFVSANGARFHVAELGDGPLVLFLHGFPQFWWAWRAPLVALAAAGYRAAAVDLRGFGASDKPPQGYDTYTSCGDVAAVVRSLGEERAVIAGHGLGGWIAWSMPSLQPATIRGVAALSMPHPTVMQRASWRHRGQRSASSYVVPLQWPFHAERTLVRDDLQVRGFLRDWAAPGGKFPSEDEVTRYADAMGLPFVAHSAAEYFRWIGRNQLRLDGLVLRAKLSAPIDVPVLQIQGGQDRAVLAEATRGSETFVRAPYDYLLIPEAGHFLPEEAPEAVSAAMIEWLPTLPR